MDTKNIQKEIEKLCDLQAEFWSGLKNTFAETDEFSTGEINLLWHQYFEENDSAIEQFIKTKHR